MSIAGKRHSGGSFGESDYRRGGLERLGDALDLLQQNRLAASAYLGGRAVESMLRAVVWKFDHDVRTGKKSLATGHDLRELLPSVRKLGVLREEERANDFAATVERVGRLWFNNMRFADSRFVEIRLLTFGAVGKRVTFRRAAERFFVD
jgi:hypothetical protein